MLLLRLCRRGDREVQLLRDDAYRVIVGISMAFHGHVDANFRRLCIPPWCWIHLYKGDRFAL